MYKQKFWIIIGGIFGFTGVALGAFGAHELKNILTPEMLEIFKTGAFYQLIHASVILAIGMAGINKFYRGGIFLSYWNYTVFIFTLSLCCNFG